MKAESQAQTVGPFLRRSQAGDDDDDDDGGDGGDYHGHDLNGYEGRISSTNC